MDKKLKAQKIISPLLIVLAALIWGISFVAQSEGGDVGSFTFQSIRCTLAFLSILVVSIIQDNTKKARLLHRFWAGLSSSVSFLPLMRELLRYGKKMLRISLYLSLPQSFFKKTAPSSEGARFRFYSLLSLHSSLKDYL